MELTTEIFEFCRSRWPGATIVVQPGPVADVLHIDWNDGGEFGRLELTHDLIRSIAAGDWRSIANLVHEVDHLHREWITLRRRAA